MHNENDKTEEKYDTKEIDRKHDSGETLTQAEINYSATEVGRVVQRIAQELGYNKKSARRIYSRTYHKERERLGGDRPYRKKPSYKHKTTGLSK